MVVRGELDFRQFISLSPIPAIFAIIVTLSLRAAIQLVEIICPNLWRV